MISYVLKLIFKILTKNKIQITRVTTHKKYLSTDKAKTLCKAIISSHFLEATQEMFSKNGVLRNVTNFTGKRLRQSLLCDKVAGLGLNFVKKESLAQVFSCEFFSISKNTFSHKTPLVAASDFFMRYWSGCLQGICLSNSTINPFSIATSGP